MWAPQFALAAQGWRVIAPHLRGLGGVAAAGDPPVQSMDDYVADLVDLLDQLPIKTAVVGGLSLGGYVAFALLRLAPRYLSGLILADTRPQADSAAALEGRRGMLERLVEGGPAAVADDMVPKLLGSTTRATRPSVEADVRRWICANPDAGIAGAIRAMMSRPDAAALLPKIECPTLVLVGDEDVVTPPAVAEEMHRAIHRAELSIVPGAGHLASLEQPERFNLAVAQFLAHRL
jgi:3-oxoadipate enol-lactonase